MSNFKFYLTSAKGELVDLTFQNLGLPQFKTEYDSKEEAIKAVIDEGYTEQISVELEQYPYIDIDEKIPDTEGYYKRIVRFAKIESKIN